MRRRGLNKIWTLALALLIALGAMGVTYGAWTDEIYIDGSLYTGDINASVTCNGPCPDSAYITCAPVPNEPMQLTFTLKDAVAGETYSCNFLINNLDVDEEVDFESLPIKRDSVTLSPDTYPGITASVINLPADPQIEPGHSAGGTVEIVVDSGITPPQSLVYTLEVTVKRWNK